MNRPAFAEHYWMAFEGLGKAAHDTVALSEENAKRRACEAVGVQEWSVLQSWGWTVQKVEIRKYGAPDV